MSSSVKLYVYDLSNGMARQLSRQLTGRQIDGIWHTSVVVFDREIFYGQGILQTAPGQSHHGAPLQILNMGETAIDEETFGEYLSEMRNMYTADKYHLLEFNCNSFTNDVVGFLTGQSIPSWISDLPSDFLSTPFGAALRPTIDAMFHRPAPGAARAPATVQPSPQTAAAAAAAPNPALAAALMQGIASQAAGAGPSPSGISTPSTSTVAAPIHICTNPSSFHNTLKTHRAVIAFFTSATCAPCRMIEPVFERLAHERTQAADAAGGGGVAFIKVDLGAGMGGMVASEYGVRVTPTFIFFRDGNKTHEMKGANAGELESQVNFLLWETYPPHPHTQKRMPALDSLSTDPILFTQVPALDTVLAKFVSFIDASSPPLPSVEVLRATLSTEVLPYLKSRFPSANAKAKGPSAAPPLLVKWTAATRTLVSSLPAAQLFPLADMWRLALLDEAVGAWCASQTALPNPVALLLDVSLAPDPPRNYLLIALRMVGNAFGGPALALALLADGPNGKRTSVTRLLVASLLHADALVRTAAASLAFNVAAFVQRGRLEQVRRRNGYVPPVEEEDGDWEVEVVSAVLQALQNETQSEDIVHRLTASLAYLLRFSPVYDNQLSPLLDVLQAKDTLKAKLSKGGCGEEGVKSPSVRKLVQQVADVLC